MRSAPLHLAAVVEAFGATLREQSGPLPSHQQRALEAIQTCRTAALGGQRWDCPHCGHHHHVYHSCRNRHCPRCQQQRQQQWLQELPAVHYHPHLHVMVTCGGLDLSERRRWRPFSRRYLFRTANLARVFRAKMFPARQSVALRLGLPPAAP